MREQHDSPSLLSYLAPGKGGIGLRIALPDIDPTTLTPDSFPFLLISDADPLTRLIKASFVTDSGSSIKDVFLLVQRDAYGVPASQLAPLTNADIEEFWQKTYQYQEKRQNGSPLITLHWQLDEQGMPAPFQPLLFCGTARAFFHPLCPSCGAPLQLCSNDQLLASQGLPSYSLSLSRYLFCPTCFSSGLETAFYARHKSAQDPPLVKDCGALARAFGQLLPDGGKGTALPCPACPENERCFGPAAAAAPPIVPFSFYPFHLLIAKAMSMSGLDFAALLAGASLEELAGRLQKTGEAGRAAYLRASPSGRGTLHSFLFAEDARLFLEVLYLKLSFFELIVTELFPDPSESQPDPLLFADRIWVRLTDRAGLLPDLWNFELSYIDLVRKPLDLPAHPPMPAAYAFHMLGLIWFTVLLTNRDQDVSQVHRAIERAREPATRNVSGIPDNLRAEPAFLPENIFWNPAPFELVEGWRRYWEKALEIGWSLFQAGVQDRVSGFKEELIRTIEELRAAIKSQMFAGMPAGKDLGRPAEAAAIHDILSRLITKWRQSAAIPAEEEWEKTVVLPVEADFEATLSPGGGSAAVPEDAAATVILAAPETQHPVVSTIDDEIFQETVILSGKGTVEPLQPEAKPPPVEELSETVILGGARVGGGGREESSASALSPAAPPGTGEARKENEELIETLILAPSSGPMEPEAAAKKPKPGEEDDLLSATIILSPSKDRDKK